MQRAAALGTDADVQKVFRHVMGRFATGVTVVTTSLEGQTFGMTANAFMAGSLEPLLCVVSIRRVAAMHERLAVARHFGVSFLSQEQQHLAAHFAGKNLPRLVPEFAYFGRTPILKRAVATVTAEVLETAPCGDHTLFVGAITSMALGDDEQPLLFYGGRYGRIERVPAADAVAPPAFW